MTYKVTRGAGGNPVCSCLDFEVESASDPAYLCEHLLAVKHAVKNNQVQEEEKIQAPATRFPVDPLARNLASLVTTGQLTMIKQRARAAGVDQDTECERVMRCKTVDLSREAAEALIEHLEEIAPVERREESAAS